MQFIFPKRLAKLIVSERSKKNVYKTSDCITAYAFFAVLKTFCKAGVIKNYYKQLTEIGNACNASNRSIYNYLKQSEKLNLLTVANGKIYLRSWHKVLEEWGIDQAEISFHKLNNENDKVKPKDLIEICEMLDAKELMAKGFLVKKAKHSNMMEAYKKCAENFNFPVEYSTENHLKLQEMCFIHGYEAESYNSLFSVNPDFQRSMRTLKTIFNYQAKNAPAYHRNRLEKLGLIKVSKRSPISCDTKRVLSGNSDAIKFRSITCLGIALKLSNLQSNLRYAYLPKGYTKRYYSNSGIANWFMPFKIELNPRLVTN